MESAHAVTQPNLHLIPGRGRSWSGRFQRLELQALHQRSGQRTRLRQRFLGGFPAIRRKEAG